jgi:hypothetical protein
MGITSSEGLVGIQPTVGVERDFCAATDDLYEVFREARMNVKYYGEKLAYYQWWNSRIEIAMAIGSSTTLMSLPFFASTLGKVLAVLLGLASAVLGILQPILNLPKKIEVASKLWAGYLSVFTSAQSLVRNVKLRKRIDAIDEDTLRDLHDKLDSLCKDDDPCPDSKDIDRLQAEVEKQYPPEEFWWPAESTSA